MGWNKWWTASNDNKDNQIKFKSSMLRLNLCDYNDAYVLVSGTITIHGAWAMIKGVISKNCAPFTQCVSNY